MSIEWKDVTQKPLLTEEHTTKRSGLEVRIRNLGGSFWQWQIFATVAGLDAYFCGDARSRTIIEKKALDAADRLAALGAHNR